MVGGALGAVPGLVLVAGIALTGGVGLLAAGRCWGPCRARHGVAGGRFDGRRLELRGRALNVEEEVATPSVSASG